MTQHSRLQGTVSTAAKTGSAIWVGSRCTVNVSDSELTANEEYGVEASATQALVTVLSCTIEDNGKGAAAVPLVGKVRMSGATAA
jgi:HKD family nuclease